MKLRSFKIMSKIAFIAIAAFLSLNLASFANNEKTMPQTLAIVPFETIASDDISYLQSGVFQMLRSRMLWKNKVNVLSKTQTQKLLESINAENPNKRIQLLADLSQSDFIITGTITQFAEAFSVDTRIYDINNKRYLTFSEQSKLISDLIPKVDFIAAKINKQVFDRNTTSYDQLVQSEKERFEQLKRQNPENLMPKIPEGSNEKGSRWKFWEYL